MYYMQYANKYNLQEYVSRHRYVTSHIIMLFPKSYHMPCRLLITPFTLTQINMFWYQIFVYHDQWGLLRQDPAVAFSPVLLLASRLFRWGKYHSFVFMSLHHKMLFFFSVSSCRLSVLWKKIVAVIMLRSSRRACHQNYLEGLINGLVLFLKSLAKTPIRQFKVVRSDILVHFSNFAKFHSW